MKNNELGFESLYMHGMGGASIDDHPRSISVEAYDGFEDAASIELAHAMESLDFMGTYEAINSKITADKIRMCKRLAVNYGKNSSLLNKQAANSIESLCLQYSLEAETEAVTSTGTKTDKKPGTDKTAKKEGFFKRMVKILKDVFEKIVTFFKTIFGNVSKFIRELFKKAPAKDVDVKDIKEAVAAKVSSNGPSEEFLGSKYFIIGGSLNFDAASNPIVTQTEALLKMMEDEKKLNAMGDKGGELNTMVYRGGSKDTAKFQVVANKVKAQTAAIMKAFGVNDGSVIDVTIKKYEKISIQKAFGVKIAEASDKAGMEAAMKWAASGENVNKAGDSLDKVIEGAAKKISNCAEKCIKYANELDNRYDAATGDAEVIGKTMVSGLRDVAKIQQSYGKLLSRLSKMVTASYKLNSCGDPDKRARKAAAANYKSPNKDKSKTIGAKLNNADRYAGEQIAKNHQQKQ